MNNAVKTSGSHFLDRRHAVASVRRGLFLAQFGDILFGAMRFGTARKLVAVLLAVFVTVGMGLSVVQASAMTAKMAMAPTMAGSALGDCQGCPTGGGDDGMKAMACGVACATPILAVLPEGALLPAILKPAPFRVREPLLDGRRTPPDPYPPRTTDIG